MSNYPSSITVDSSGTSMNALFVFTNTGAVGTISTGDATTTVTNENEPDGDITYDLSLHPNSNFYLYGPLDVNSVANEIQLLPTVYGDPDTLLIDISGVYILFVAAITPAVTSPYATGGTVIHVGGTTYAHVFTDTINIDTFTVKTGSLVASILCVGGGGRGGSDSTTGGNGGGGAGAYGVIINQQLSSSSSYDIHIGAGSQTAINPGMASFILQNNNDNILLYAGGGGSATINTGSIDNGSDGTELGEYTITIDNVKAFRGCGAGASSIGAGANNGGLGGTPFFGSESTTNGGNTLTSVGGGGGGGGASGNGLDEDDGNGGGGKEGFRIDQAGINPATPLIHSEFNNFPDIPDYTVGKVDQICYGGGGGAPTGKSGGVTIGGAAGGSGGEAGEDATTYGSGGGGGGFHNGASFDGGNGASGLVIIYYTAIPICFPAGTEVETDQGLVEIQIIQPGFHTIGGKRIVAISKSGGTKDCLVKVSKSAISQNVPNKDTIMTRWHKVHHGNRLRESWRLPNTSKYPYSGQVLYNVLMERYQTMRVNNMIVETLHPDSEIAKPYLNKN